MEIDVAPLGPGARFVIVVSRYNEAITSKLLAGAKETLLAAGIAEDAIDVIWAPGAFELPLIAKYAVRHLCCSAVICLGAVIRGETTHDQHINSAVSNALMAISLEHETPVMFGVLTCESMEQAFARAGGAVGNKGLEAALAALHAVSVLQQMKSGATSR